MPKGESIDSPFFFTLFSSFSLFQKVIPFYLFYKSNLLFYNI
ncbi:putative membrane protein [Lactobacillus delbrueckii subsp. lactis CRL581]|nr:putative membrane protein [Lactobacillus delbrueckii subsp. lactis CRL581]